MVKMTLLARDGSVAEDSQRRHLYTFHDARTVIYRRRIIYSHGTSLRVGYASCNNNDGILAHKREDPSNVSRSSRCEHSHREAGMHRPTRIPRVCSLSVELSLMSFSGVARCVSYVFQRYPREHECKRASGVIRFYWINGRMGKDSRV